MTNPSAVSARLAPIEGRLNGTTLLRKDEITVFIEHGNALVCAGLMAVLGREDGFNPVEWIPDRVGEAGPVLRGASCAVVIADYEAGLRHIQSTTPIGHRVVILTHRDSEAEICHALECGARGYLLLDVGPGELIESLRLAQQGGVALAPSVAIRVADRLKQQPLTAREREVLAQLMLGLSNKVIAASLMISIGSVKTHVKSVLEKLHAVSRTQAVTIAQRRGLLVPDNDGFRPMPALRGQHLIYGGQRRKPSWRRPV